MYNIFYWWDNKPNFYMTHHVRDRETAQRYAKAFDEKYVGYGFPTTGCEIVTIH